MKAIFYWPAKPYIVNQAWGISNPIYKQFGFSRHNGIDIRLGTDSKLYAPCKGTIVRTGYQPEGGGNFFGLISEPMEFEDGTYRTLIDFLHCESISVIEGQVVDIGDLLAVADNTGFSTGHHTHLQPRRASFWNGLSGNDLIWDEADKNDANNSYDISKYWGKCYAQDYYKLVGYLQTIIILLSRLLALQSK